MSTSINHDRYRLWQRFRSRRAGRIALGSLRLMIILALASPFLANDRPWYLVINQRAYSPLLQGILVDAGLGNWPKDLLPATDWAQKPCSQVIFTAIPYAPETIDHANLGAKGPFERQRVQSWRFRHWLGTDASGRDIAAGMLHGVRSALWVGLVAVSIALLLGLLLGGLAGYFGDHGLILSRASLWAMALPLPLLWFYWSYLPGSQVLPGPLLMLGYLLLYFGLVSLLRWLLLSRPIFNKRITLALDTLTMRMLEVVDAIPSIILIIIILVVFQRTSVTYMMAVVGLVSSASVARFIRAEFLRQRKQTYMEAGRALGFSHIRLIFRHALPNAIGPLLVLMSFLMANAILAESTLAVLGVGPAERVSWGSILGQLNGKHNIDWWLAVFPGLAIFGTILTFRFLSEGLSEAIGEK